RVVDLGGERAGEQDRAAMAADLASRGGHPGVLVLLDVLVVPGSLALPWWPSGGGEDGGDERREHRVLVQQSWRRHQRGEEQPGDGALAGAGRAGHDPGRGEVAHEPRMTQLCAGTRAGSAGRAPGCGVSVTANPVTSTGNRNASSPVLRSTRTSSSSAAARTAIVWLARCGTVVRARTSH